MIKVSKQSFPMAKGRIFGSIHQDRLFGSNGYHPDQANVGDHSEMAEEDVWPMDYEAIDHEGAMRTVRSDHLTVRSRQWDRSEDRHVGGLSLAFEAEGNDSSRIVHQFRGTDEAAAPLNGTHMATSAPLDVPDLRKMLRIGSAESMHDGYGFGDDDDDDRAEWVPPHEYLARSRRNAAHSVFEGVGRTLKGRDMSRVRNAVWSRTGFPG